MSSDIFLLAKETRGRSNPIVTALLYEYCSLAGYWYARNTPVEESFDITWKAMEDYATGKTLTDFLRKYGLEAIIPEAKNYVDKVTTFRRHHTNEMPAPETTLIFKYGRRLDSTYGIQNELMALGGSWNNFLEYVRIWAFMMRDWTTGMKLPRGENTTRTLKKFTVSFSAPGVHSKLRIHFPVFGWEVAVGRVRSVYLGLFVSNRIQDALRFHLVNNSDLVGEHPWPDQKRPFVYALDRVTGEVDYMNPKVAESHALGSVMPSYKLARIGPNIMPAAFRDYYRCSSCGYRKACYGERGTTISEAIVERLLREDKHERFHLTGFVEPKQSEG